MAIDTAAKRRSAIATRRLPWFRRFQPGPDGAMDQGDRQQLAFVYRGILAEAEVVTADPDQTYHARPRGEVFHARPRGEVFHAKGR